MSLSSQEKQHLLRLKSEGKTFTEAMSFIGAARTGRASIPNESPTVTYTQQFEQAEKEGRSNDFLSDIKSGFSGAVEAIDRGVDRVSETSQREGFFGRTLGAFGAGTRAAGEALGSVGEGLFRALPGGTTAADTVETVVGAGFEKGIEGAQAIDEATDGRISGSFEKLPEGVKQTAGDVGNVLLGGAGIVGAANAPGVLSTATRGVTNFSSDLLKQTYNDLPSFKNIVDEQDVKIEQAIATNNEAKRTLAEQAIDIAVGAASQVADTYKKLVDGSSARVSKTLDDRAVNENIALRPEQVDNNIADMYVNAVSPGVKGKKKSLAAINANKQSAVTSIKDIVNNRSDIRFRDVETNEMVTGELPSNLWEYGGAITERKSTIYNQILDSIEASGDVAVDSTRIISSMQEIVNNPVYDALPTIKSKAEGVIELFSRNDYSPAQVEELIKIYNDSLQAFYRGGGTQADSVVDAMVANNLRDILDETVEEATGDGIKDLKRLYGDYRSIENDVVHRALHNDQAREAGLVDMFGIRNIGDLSASIGTGGLSNLRQSAGQIVGEGFVKALNDRDALINRMFLVGDRVYTNPDS